MRLKRLSLFGFKSFAQRTELVFAPGITAIVGPNGSGKSNLLDAILWVLGERSTKSLRSPKAADLLFAGNGKVKPASLAEVSLMLELDDENLDGRSHREWLQALSELVISRRLKRTGESQFAINRIPCRLKDVQDLLLELGLSPDSYAFITQAEIDRLVLLSPQERREFIEQVAGVHRFRLRREETLDKLGRTDRNLVRLRDLMAELQHQREALTAEVEKARRYQHLLQRQRELQIALLGWEHQVRLRRVERWREELATLKQRVAELSQQRNALTAQRQAAEETLQRMDADLRTLQQQATQTLETAKALENELALCQERRHHLVQRRRHAEQQLSAITQRWQKLQAEWEELQRQRDALWQQREQFAKQETQWQAQLKQVQQRVAELEAQWQDAHDELFDAERTVTETRSQLAALEPLLKTLRARQAEVQSELKAAMERLTEWQRRSEELTEQLNALRPDELDATTHLLRHRLEELLTHRERLAFKQNTLREQLAAAKARLAALEEMEMSLSGLPQGAKAVLMAVREGQLTGEFHLLAHLLRVPEGLEIAYEAALGAAANYLVAPTFQEVQKAIEFLKRQNAGRATFLALDFLAELGKEAMGEGKMGTRDAGRGTERGKGDGVIGWASELVQVTDERFGHAVRSLLRHTLIVDDLKVARRLAPQYRHVRFVTLSGEVIAPSGTISGGATFQGAGNIFQRQREREELSHRIRQLEAQSQAILSQWRANEQEIAALQQELAHHQQQKQERQRRAEQLTAERERVEAERMRWQREVERLRAEEIRLVKEQEQLQQEAEQLRQRLEQSLIARDAVQERLLQLQTALTEAQQHRDALAQAWQQMQMTATQWQAQWDNLQQRSDALTDAIAETERQREALQKELVELAEEERALEERLPQLERELKICLQRHAEAENALARWHERRQALLQRRDELERQLSAVMAQYQEAAEELHRCEVRLAEAEAERTAMERRLLEEFGVTPEVAHAAAHQLEQKQSALDELERVRQEMAAMGEVRLGVLDEFERLNERVNFLSEQIADLETARVALLQQMAALEEQFKARFREVLEEVSHAFNEMVQRFWQGGEGRLVLTEGATLAESGVEVKVKLPGKAEQDLLALSGGEKAIVGLCLLFAFLKINPTPFVLLDEVDAPLDDTNTERFVGLLREFADRTQFIVITHNPVTVQAADHLYGVTMEEEGISKVLSLSLKEALAWTETDAPSAVP